MPQILCHEWQLPKFITSEQLRSVHCIFEHPLRCQMLNVQALLQSEASLNQHSQFRHLFNIRSEESLL